MHSFSLILVRDPMGKGNGEAQHDKMDERERDFTEARRRLGKWEKKAYNLVCMLCYAMPLILPMLPWSAVF